MINVRIDGITRPDLNPKSLRPAIRNSLVMLKKSSAKKIGSRRGKGRQYTKRGIKWKASRPTDFPSRYTGTLRRYLKYRVGRSGYFGDVTLAAPHTHLLFLGTKNITARKNPIDASMKELAPQIENDLTVAMYKAIGIIKL